MSHGKYLSLEEARKQKKLDRFAKEHETEGDEKLFDETLNRMATKPKKPKTDSQQTCTETSERSVK